MLFWAVLNGTGPTRCRCTAMGEAPCGLPNPRVLFGTPAPLPSAPSPDPSWHLCLTAGRGGGDSEGSAMQLAGEPGVGRGAVSGHGDAGLRDRRGGQRGGRRSDRQSEQLEVLARVS